MVFWGYWFHPFLSFSKGRLGNHLTSSTIMIQWAPLVCSHNVRKHRPCQSGTRCCFPQPLHTLRLQLWSFASWVF